MKKIIISLVLLAMLAGCLGQAGTAQSTKEEVGKALGNVTAAPVKELISVSGSDNLSVVSISAVNQNGSWLFPMKDYEGQFQSAGLYSTAFIRLNDSQISWLDSGERIWLTLMVRNGTGVLFNAIYSNDAVNCSAGNVRILGRDYALSGLRNGSSFLMDDKWKVVLDSKGGCPSRIVIYLDGYFYGMKDNERIPLFRNDNTVLFGFDSLESGPVAKVIATMHAEMNVTATAKEPEPSNVTAAVEPEVTSSNSTAMAEEPELGPSETTHTLRIRWGWTNDSYNETIATNATGMSISFDPALPVFSVSLCDPPGVQDENCLSDNNLYINGSQWAIARLRAANSTLTSWDSAGANVNSTIGSDEFVMGKTEQIETEDNAILRQGEPLMVGNRTYFVDVRGNAGARLYYGNNYDFESLTADNPKQINGEWVQLRRSQGWNLATMWADIFVYDELVNVTSDPNVTLTWNRDDPANPALESIFIPRSSPIFEKLTG